MPLVFLYRIMHEDNHPWKSKALGERRRRIPPMTNCVCKSKEPVVHNIQINTPSNIPQGKAKRRGSEHLGSLRIREGTKLLHDRTRDDAVVPPIREQDTIPMVAI